MRVLKISFVLVGLWLWSSRGVKSSNSHQLGDPIPFYANIIGPFHNPSETYQYYDLPFCSSENVTVRKESLGEVLNGHRLVDSPYKIQYCVSHKSQLLCKKKLAKEDVVQFKNAIARDYYFQMYFDDLPIWGFIGKREGNFDPTEFKYFLFRHLHFDIYFNNNRVIEINVQTDNNDVMNVTEGREIEVDFMYSVKWKETERLYEKRMDRYMNSIRMRHYHQVQWFSTLNSCVIVLLLTGFLATILMGVLKKDLIKYTNDLESDNDQNETGWKIIHGDVFRFPENKSVFSACIGAGTQLLVLCFVNFILSLLGLFRPYSRGAPLAALILVYAFTSAVAGYTSASFYFQLEGTNWVYTLRGSNGFIHVWVLYLLLLFSK